LATGWTNVAQFPAGEENFFSFHRIQTGSGAHQASYLMGTGSLSLGVKLQWREVDHTPPTSDEVKE